MARKKAAIAQALMEALSRKEEPWYEDVLRDFPSIDSDDARACGIHLWLLVEALEELPSAPEPQAALEEAPRLAAALEGRGD